MKHGVKGIIFDLDGTLVHSIIDFRKMKGKMIEYLISKGVDAGLLSSQETNVVILSKSEKRLAEKGIPQDEIKRTLEHVEEIMNEVEMESVADVTEIEGAREALKKLKEQGYKTAILTRGHHDYSVEALKNTGLLEYFDLILGREETPKPKPYPEAMEYTAKLLKLSTSELILVGDHLIDLECAKNAKVRFIGVLTGSAKPETWREAGCSEVLAGVGELPEYLEKTKKNKE
jgi:HAD superfamily hydrolase (TIGR01549 family)